MNYLIYELCIIYTENLQALLTCWDGLANLVPKRGTFSPSFAQYIYIFLFFCVEFR
jgi:hypothetical protein